MSLMYLHKRQIPVHIFVGCLVLIVTLVVSCITIFVISYNYYVIMEQNWCFDVLIKPTNNFVPIKCVEKIEISDVNTFRPKVTLIFFLASFTFSPFSTLSKNGWDKDKKVLFWGWVWGHAFRLFWKSTITLRNSWFSSRKLCWD